MGDGWEVGVDWSEPTLVDLTAIQWVTTEKVNGEEVPQSNFTIRNLNGWDPPLEIFDVEVQESGKS